MTAVIRSETYSHVLEILQNAGYTICIQGQYVTTGCSVDVPVELVRHCLKFVNEDL
jgi:hypothetical protein